MDIKSIDEQKNIFHKYTNEYINSADDNTKGGYIDKYNHSLFVLEEALLIDAIFTEYNDSFKNLLALESLFHDIGRFEQLKLIGSFKDSILNKSFPNIEDHGVLGASIMKEEGLLQELVPDVRIYDDEIMNIIRLHCKVNHDLLDGIRRDYIYSFKNYDLKELFLSDKSIEEKDTLTRVNTAIIQDVDRLDIFRKIVKGIWVPMVSDDEIDPELFELFKQNKLPTINELKNAGKWNSNVGHLIRMSFINQMNLVPVLKKIRDENLIDKVYQVSGNNIVLPAYEYVKEEINDLINNSEDGIIVKVKKRNV